MGSFASAATALPAVSDRFAAVVVLLAAGDVVATVDSARRDDDTTEVELEDAVVDPPPAHPPMTISTDSSPVSVTTTIQTGCRSRKPSMPPMNHPTPTRITLHVTPS